MSRPALELRPGQHLTLTPQLQQSIRLLQLSTLDLELEIAQALADNPLLERAETVEAEGETSISESQEAVSEASTPEDNGREHDDIGVLDAMGESYGSGIGGSDYGDDDPGVPEAAGNITLREHLLGQLGVTRVTERDRALTTFLIDELDENGYLASSLEVIQTWFSDELAPDIDELRASLSLLQSFDPAGVGAADLSECLLLQLRAGMHDAPAPVLAVAREICLRHLPLLATGNSIRLRDALKCDEATMRAAHALIVKLDPRPGRAWTVPAADFAVPDVVVRKVRNAWRVSLNGAAVPKLRVNGLYAQVLGNQRASHHAGLQSQLQQAKWMIKNVEQRFNTILRVSQAIVDRQAAFFTEGPSAMQPLILKDIANEIGMHESTISRATTQKYMLTPFGTMELKRFFGAGVATDSGVSASATAVQEFIRKLVDAENRAKPLSDSQITKKLAEDGIVIARRTVAKYREMLRIQPAALRKSHALAR